MKKAERILLSSGRCVLTEEHESDFFVMGSNRGMSGPYSITDIRFSVPLSSQRVNICVGDMGRKVLCYSEVCMHMQVAGTMMPFLLMPSESWGACVQLFRDEPDGGVSMFSSPIMTGEAGIFKDDQGYYYYMNDHGG